MNKSLIIYSLGGVVLFSLILLSITVGSVHIPIDTVVESLLKGFGLAAGELSPANLIIFELRLPRVLFSAIIGAGLGIIGVVLQTTTRNDLADPFLFGLSSGAAAGAVLVITVTGDILGFWTLPIASFFGGIIASIIVLVLVNSLSNSTPEKLVLAGLAVSFLFISITNYLIFSGDSRAAHSVIFWMLGGLGLARWDTVPLILFGLLLIVFFSTYYRRSLDALLAGDTIAASLGVSIGKFRMIIFFIASLSTAIFVSVSGVIGFVGLMVPHLARSLVGTLHTNLIPSSSIIGAILLTASDIVSRVIIAPQELSVGIITTGIGAVFVFIMLINEHKKNR